MNALNSFAKLILLVLVVFVVFGWLIRDHFQLASDLTSARSQIATLQAKHNQDAQAYQARIAELEQLLARAQRAEAQYEQLLVTYNDLQSKAASDAQTIEQLRQALLAEGAARAYAEATYAQYQTAYESLQQTAANDMQNCLNQVAALQGQQSEPRSPAPEVQAPGATLPDAAVGAGLLAFTVTMGAIGIVANRPGRSSRPHA